MFVFPNYLDRVSGEIYGGCSIWGPHDVSRPNYSLLNSSDTAKATRQKLLGLDSIRDNEIVRIVLLVVFFSLSLTLLEFSPRFLL